MESYKHKFAKNQFLDWLDNPKHTLARRRWYDTMGFTLGGDFNLEEYPVALDEKNEVHGLWPNWLEDWGDVNFDNKVPTYDQLIEAKLLPILIFDLVCISEGVVHAAIEIVHKNKISSNKLRFMDRLCDAPNCLDVYEIEADWILSQVNCPYKLELRHVFQNYISPKARRA